MKHEVLAEGIEIYCADCLDVMREMPDNSVDAVITDPPYGISYQSNMRSVSQKFDRLQNDSNDMRLMVYSKLHRVVKDNSIVGCFASFKNYATDYLTLSKTFDIKNVVVWDKGGGGIGDLTHSLLTDYELLIVAHNGSCQIRGKRDGSVWEFRKVNPSDMVHPTEKPTPLLEKVVLKWTDEGNKIFDPFMGSGTTGVACVQTGRRFIGIEIDPDYYEIAKKRIKEALMQPRLL